MNKNKITIKQLKPEEDQLGLDTKADLVIVQIESNKDDTIKYEAITPEESINRLNTYNNIISRLTGILEEPIDKESEIYIELTLYKRLREKLIIGISEFETNKGQILLVKDKSGIKSIKEADVTLTKKEATKGGRPPNPEIAERNKKIRQKYYRLTSNKNLKKKEALKQLSDKYKLAISTIEKYLK